MPSVRREDEEEESEDLKDGQESTITDGDPNEVTQDDVDGLDGLLRVANGVLHVESKGS
jgi:hypothetical protein